MNLEQFNAALQKAKPKPKQWQYEKHPESILTISEVHGPADGELGVEDWLKEREFQNQHPPVEGDYLRTVDGTPVRVELKFEQGKLPFFFSRVFVPNHVGQVLSWYARGRDDGACYGMKCILLPKSVEGIIKRGGINAKQVEETGIIKKLFFVKELIVVRRSRDGRSYMCEVSEW